MVKSLYNNIRIENDISLNKFRGCILDASLYNISNYDAEEFQCAYGMYIPCGDK